MNRLYFFSQIQRIVICSNFPSKIRARFAVISNMTMDPNTRFGEKYIY